MTVAHEKCAYHPERAAAGRCPECESFYCRECITEHEGKVICASCLDDLTEENERAEKTGFLLPFVKTIAGIFLSWLFFFGLARTLIELSEPLREELPF